MKRRKDLRTGIAALGILSLIAVGSVSATPTEAAWTEPEYGKTNAITAATLVAPASATCIQRSVLLLGLQSVTLKWSSPQQGSQRVQIQRGSNTGTDIQGTAGSVISQTGNAGGAYQYQAVYDTTKLLGLINLANLLGGSYTIRIYNGAGDAWVSPPKTFNLNVILLGLGSSCTAV